MVDDWIPIFVLPNIRLLAPIGCDITVLTPPSDPRVAKLKHAHSKFGQFLGRFSDNFGEKFEPAVLLLRVDTPSAFYNISTLSSFRDLIAVSTIAHSRTMKLISPNGGPRVMFGEAFAIYPWMLDKHFEDVIGNTPAILGTHDVAMFKGQSSPAIFRTALDVSDLDQPLLAALLNRWRRRYGTSNPDWADVALFRSLNMAYHASLLPAGTDTTFFDIGRLLSLWVSAFEILVHPGGDGIANMDKVFDLMERTPWLLQPAADRVHETGGKTKEKRTLASWLYHALYQCRNRFLHGNPVERADLVLPVSERNVFDYAAPLYRLALTSFLPLIHDTPLPSSDDVQAFAAQFTENMKFIGPQRQTEEAILTANQPPHQTRVKHRRVTRPEASP